jgi:hypothetical protein
MALFGDDFSDNTYKCGKTRKDRVIFMSKEKAAVKKEQEPSQVSTYFEHFTARLSLLSAGTIAFTSVVAGVIGKDETVVETGLAIGSTAFMLWYGVFRNDKQNEAGTSNQKNQNGWELKKGEAWELKEGRRE